MVATAASITEQPLADYNYMYSYICIVSSSSSILVEEENLVVDEDINHVID